MSPIFKSARFSVVLVLLLLLGLVCDRQALAGQTTLQDIPPIVHSYLPLVLSGYDYVEPTGVLDPTFGENGVVSTDLGFLEGDRTIYDLIVQPDGKIVAGGYTWDGAEYQFALARFEPDGRLDASFDEEGWVVIDLLESDIVQGIALQPDGKIVVAGYTYAVEGITEVSQFALLRLEPDGSLDISFDGDGWLTTVFQGNDHAYDVAVQSDGKIIVVGSTITPGGANVFALARYHPNGNLDNSFGNGGKVVTYFDDAGLVSYGQAYSIVILPDNKILVAGSGIYFDPYCESTLVLARYLPDGSLDSSFIVDGLLKSSVNLIISPYSEILLQPDRKIVAVSQADGNTQDLAVVRFNSDGTLDNGFAQAGVVISDWGCNENPAGIVMQPNGKIIVAGTVWCTENTAYILARYYPDGSLDTSFGYYGKILTELGAGDQAHNLKLQTDGKIVVGGSKFDYYLSDFTLVRYK